MKRIIGPFAAVLCILLYGPVFAVDPGTSSLYQFGDGPLAIESVPTFTLHDPAQNKDIELRLTFPKDPGQYPIIIFSHGATGSKDGYEPLRNGFASHGYIVIQPTHGDSIKKLGLRGVLNPREVFKHWQDRPLDIRCIFDHLADIETAVPELTGKLDRDNIAMAGHSFGAHTSMCIAGLKLHMPIINKVYDFTDPRPKCFVMISPQGPGNLITETAYKDITRPTMIITGSKDTSIEHKPPSWRLKVFDGLGSKEKYLLYVDGAYHGFGGIAGKARYPSSGPPNIQQVHQVESAALAMFDAYLKNIEAAKKFLHSDALRRK